MKMPSKKVIEKAKRKIICPQGFRHIDKGKFAKTPHKKHLCVHGKKKSFFFTKTPTIGV